MIRSEQRRLLPKWRNWQTRQLQELVPVQGVQVQVLSSALMQDEGLRRGGVNPFCVPCLSLGTKWGWGHHCDYVANASIV